MADSLLIAVSFDAYILDIYHARAQMLVLCLDIINILLVG